MGRILPVEGQRIIFQHFALYFYETTVDSITHIFKFIAQYFYVDIKSNIKIKFALIFFFSTAVEVLYRPIDLQRKKVYIVLNTSTESCRSMAHKYISHRSKNH